MIAAAVTYIMWKHVGNDKIPKVEGKRKKMNDGDDGFDSDGTLDPKKRRGYWRVDCQGASKGLFMGLLCLVGGIIILIIFFVMKVCLQIFFSGSQFFQFQFCKNFFRATFFENLSNFYNNILKIDSIIRSLHLRHIL